MPSRIVGNLGVAVALAVFAVFVFLVNHDTGAWREHFLHATVGVSSQTSSESRSTTAQPTKKGGEEAGAAAAKAAAAAAAKVKVKAKAAAKTTLSKEVKDDATGLVLPRTKRFGSSKASLTCLGAGVRAKSIAITKVNVYTVGE